MAIVQGQIRRANAGQHLGATCVVLDFASEAGREGAVKYLLIEGAPHEIKDAPADLFETEFNYVVWPVEPDAD
jgi:hypothetical protein